MPSGMIKTFRCGTLMRRRYSGRHYIRFLLLLLEWSELDLFTAESPVSYKGVVESLGSSLTST
jgi:hypothetical protein